MQLKIHLLLYLYLGLVPVLSSTISRVEINKESKYDIFPAIISKYVIFTSKLSSFNFLLILCFTQHYLARFPAGFSRPSAAGVEVSLKTDKLPTLLIKPCFSAAD